MELPQFTHAELDCLDDAFTIGTDMEEDPEELFATPEAAAAYVTMTEKFAVVLSILRDRATD